jgi:hypothetical protein
MRTAKTAEEIKAMIMNNVNSVIAKPLSEIDVTVLASPGLEETNYDAGSARMFETLGPGDAIVVRHEIRLLKERYDIVL